MSTAFESPPEPAHRPLSEAELAEVRHFVARYQARRPVVTYALAAACAIVFLLELLWGGPSSTRLLLRMGATTPGILEGEWWRLVSGAFLHGGWMHIAFNTMALVSLGRNLERILGARRFLVLYGLSAIGGALGTVLLSPLTGAALSVGASGAIVGLFGANAVLAWRPHGILPAVIHKQARQTAMGNLVLLAAISFVPRVDWAGHLGGLIVGAALMASGLLTWGLPRLDEHEADDRVPLPVTLLAVLVLLFLPAGLAAAFWHGQPWAYGAPPRLFSVALPEVGLVAALPADLQPTSRTRREDGGLEILFGDLRRSDGMVLLIVPSEDPDLLALSLDTWVDIERQYLEQQHPAVGRLTVVKSPEVDPGPPPKVYSRSAVADRVLVDRVITLLETRPVTVEVSYWREAEAAWRGLADRIAASLSETGIEGMDAGDTSH
ncbi:MAG: rhomboid family intramembrane serine protease [Deltaproteobacteria bacterium]|nr:MAG: rhomboid family intramembrane serine protease [Deltaproteobacteria bacterium]